MNMIFKKEMPTAELVREMYPMTAEMIAQKEKNDWEIRRVLTGEDDRLLLIIGPCSADREDALLDYTARLRRLQEKVAGRFVIIPRIYSNKPRTTGDGYKGMLHQPDPNASPDLCAGLYAIRKLHIDVLRESGFSCADEMLYPENYPYLADCLSYVTVGARSVENQLHRLTASGLDIPVGMKNPTGGDLTVMLNAIHAASQPQSFVYAGWEVESRGNPLAHAVLRGYCDRHGRAVPNYHSEDLGCLWELYRSAGLPDPAVVVDCNHANSGKQWEKQPMIAKEVLHSALQSDEIRRMLKGLMIESYIEDGNQPPDGGVYGKSITDGCLGWEKTERLVAELAELWK